MNRVFSFLVSTFLIVTIGCDPGMSIRQATENANDTGQLNAVLVIRVATTHQLIGEMHYAPKVQLDNSGNDSLTITRVELLTRGGTYANHPWRSTSYPMKLRTKETEGIDVKFDLVEPVHKVFEETAILRIHYLVGGNEQIATATLVKGSVRD